MAKIREGDRVEAEIFGKPKKLEVIVTGDNNFDYVSGHYKEPGFELTDEEEACINWLLQNVRLEDYRAEIAKYCEVTNDAVEDEIDIRGIAVNVAKVIASKDGKVVYPEVAFMGECKYDDEHGICIGFRDGKFLGIAAQNWVL